MQIRQNIQDDYIKNERNYIEKDRDEKKLACIPSEWFIHNLFEGSLISLKKKKAIYVH